MSEYRRLLPTSRFDLDGWFPEMKELSKVEPQKFCLIHMGAPKCDDVLGVHSEPIGGWEEITAESLTTRRTGLH